MERESKQSRREREKCFGIRGKGFDEEQHEEESL